MNPNFTPLSPKNQPLSICDLRVFEQLDYFVRLARSRGRVGYAYCSQQWLADYLGYSRETINRSIKRLVEGGYLTKLRKRLGGRWPRCRYWIKTRVGIRAFLRAQKGVITKKPSDVEVTLAHIKVGEEPIKAEKVGGSIRKDKKSSGLAEYLETRWKKKGLIREKEGENG